MRGPAQVQETPEQKAAREILLADMRFMLQNPQSKRFLWYILSLCEVYDVCVSPNNAEKFQHDGKRLIGNSVIGTMMQADKNALGQLMAENAASFTTK